MDQRTEGEQSRIGQTDGEEGEEAQLALCSSCSPLQEPVQSRIINTGHVAFTDRDIAAQVARSSTVEQVHFAAKRAADRATGSKRKEKQYASLSDVAPFIGLELPKDWQSPSAAPSDAVVPENSSSSPHSHWSDYEEKWFQVTAYPSESQSELRASSSSSKKLNPATVKHREALKEWPGFKRLLAEAEKKMPKDVFSDKLDKRGA